MNRLELRYSFCFVVVYATPPQSPGPRRAWCTTMDFLLVAAVHPAVSVYMASGAPAHPRLLHFLALGLPRGQSISQDSESVSASGGYGYSEATASVGASAVIMPAVMPAGHSLCPARKRVRVVPAGGLEHEPRPSDLDNYTSLGSFSIPYYSMGGTGSCTGNPYGSGCTFLFVAPPGPITVELQQSSEAESFGLWTASGMADLNLQLWQDDWVTPLDAYVDQTPEPGTLWLGLAPLSLFVGWKLNRHHRR